MTPRQTILLIGGNGTTGRRVANRLGELGRPFRIGSRSAEPAFDWNDSATWAGALAGAGSAYITYYPDVTVPGAVEAIGAFIRLAVDSGCARLVLLSGRGEEEALRTEQLLMRSGADWTVVRSAWFMQNFSENFFLDGVRAGEVFFPADRITEPFVDADDIADVVAAALTEDGHGGRIYELTGPRLMTFADGVGEIERATGREIRYVPITVEDHTAMLREQEVPADYVALLEYLAREVLDGRNESLADGVQRALGRPPRDFSEYARITAETGVWRTRT